MNRMSMMTWAVRVLAARLLQADMKATLAHAR